jgi:catechol 2,3-dioxygenase-like lactoylglutathione lyase family enzyme
MEFHKGRLIDHVHLIVSDVNASKRFYRAILDVIGIPFGGEDEGYFWADELFVNQGEVPTSHLHLAFQVHSREAVHRFYDVALAVGGRDNGAPGERRYHPGYYAAFALDPDDNNIEAVYHGPARRSAASVVLVPELKEPHLR